MGHNFTGKLVILPSPGVILDWQRTRGSVLRRPAILDIDLRVTNEIVRDHVSIPDLQPKQVVTAGQLGSRKTFAFLQL